MGKREKRYSSGIQKPVEVINSVGLADQLTPIEVHGKLLPNWLH